MVPVFVSPPPDLSLRYCTDCTVYVSVFGYKEGQYSIVASQGLTRLREGIAQQGTVGGGEASTGYYEFFNPQGLADRIQVHNGVEESDKGEVVSFFPALPRPGAKYPNKICTRYI